MGDVGEIKRFLDTVKTADEIDKNWMTIMI
jgi:hypothetical protein